MKKFMVQDFINYNAPCFSCGGRITFTIGTGSLDDTNPDHVIASLRPTITPNYTEIDLRISYIDTLKLYIFHKTNKILTNNQQGLTTYLSEHKLNLRSICSQCQTQIKSQFLEFDLTKSVVKAVGLYSEWLHVADKETTYYNIESFFDKNESHLYIGQASPINRHIQSMKLPLLPKYHFKNRQHFLDKIKTYVLFS